MLLEGIFVPLTTPFYPDGRLYLRKLEHNVDRYSRTPAAGLLVLGETGEAGGLTDEESREALTAAIGVAAKHKVMIACVGRESVFATLALAEYAATAGYDCIAVRAPEFVANETMRVELMTYFRAVADKASLPVVVVSEAGRAIPLEVLAELAGHGNVVGALGDFDFAALRERTLTVSREVTVTTVFAAATGRMLRQVETVGPATFVSAESLGGGSALAVAELAPAIKTRKKKVGFQMLSSATASMLAAWQKGASGSAPRLAACTPQGCCEVWQAFKDGDTPLSEEKQLRVEAAAKEVDRVAAIKHGCDVNGYFGGRPRLPLIGLTGEERAEVERVLDGLRN